MFTSWVTMLFRISLRMSLINNEQNNMQRLIQRKSISIHVYETEAELNIINV